jgi:phosphoribosylformylglycinamidine cyclo-ligase
MTSKPSSPTLRYADAGVDIDAGDALIDQIKPLAKSTARTGSNPDLGGFGGLFDLAACGFRDPVLVSGTDGVGTKLEVAQQAGKHDTIGIDLVGMCVNDVLAQGAEPLFFLDYLATGKLDPDVATSVISGIAAGCRDAGCALIGGETAEMPGMYRAGSYDLAGFVVGAVERDAILPRSDEMRRGDLLIALPSSGAHSNGYSLIRRIVAGSGLDWNNPAPFAPDQPLAEALLAPTRLYVRALLPLIRSARLKGLAHITGGGLITNPPRMCPDHLQAVIDFDAWELPPLFQWLEEAGPVERSEMHKTFNCGIGMLVCVAAGDAPSVLASLIEAGEQAFICGELKPA